MPASNRGRIRRIGESSKKETTTKRTVAAAVGAIVKSSGEKAGSEASDGVAIDAVDPIKIESVPLNEDGSSSRNVEYEEKVTASDDDGGEDKKHNVAIRKDGDNDKTDNGAGDGTSDDNDDVPLALVQLSKKQRVEAREECGVETTAEGGEKSESGDIKTRLDFGKNERTFVAFARIYARRELFKKVVGKSEERWCGAMDEFYGGEFGIRRVRPHWKRFNKSFNYALDVRMDGLPLRSAAAKVDRVTESKADAICREIEALAKQAAEKTREEKTAKFRDEPLFGTKKKQLKRARHAAAGGSATGEVGENDGIGKDSEERVAMVKRKRKFRYTGPECDLPMTEEVLEILESKYNATFDYKRAKAASQSAQEEFEEARSRMELANTRVEEAEAGKRNRSEVVADELLRFDCPWSTMFRRLVVLKETNGDLVIQGDGKEEQELKEWCHDQRRINTRKVGLPWFRKLVLDKIGFCWSIAEEGWKERYRELIAYKGEHGDCLVPRSYQRNPKLAVSVVCL